MRYTGAMIAPTAGVEWVRLIPMAILAASVGALAVAYIAEFVFGLEPCILCLYQRVPYAVTGILAILALGLPPRSGVRAASVALCGAVFLAGAGIAVYHVGVEQHWWAGTAACAGALPAEMTVEALRAQLATRPPKPCDQVDWTLFGISFAGYNLMASLALAAFSLAAARRLMKAS